MPTEFPLIIFVTLLASLLTFFTGFGLGTLLLPVFALFFPLPAAIAATAIVHLTNNLFKAILLGRYADLPTLLRFTLPAALMAIPGALTLQALSNLPTLGAYHWGSRELTISPVKLAIALLMLAFALQELLPKLKSRTVSPKYLPLGGALSGFFGGLSGQQGALRGMFLIRLGLDKNAYLATSVLSAVAVDVFRLTVYGLTTLPGELAQLHAQQQTGLIAVGCLSALIGSLLGRKLLKKISMQAVETLVGILLLVFSAALGLGWI